MDFHSELVRTQDGFPAFHCAGVAYIGKTDENGSSLIKSRLLSDAKQLPELGENAFPGRWDRIDQSFEVFFVETVAEQRQIDALGRRRHDLRTVTPWGRSQGGEIIAEDALIFHSTARHGGMKVYKKINQTIPECLRNKDGWYEEDQEVAKVMFARPEYFTSREVARATQTIINYYPDEYEQVTGITIPEDQSITKARRAFEARHADDFIVISASHVTEGDEKYIRCIATMGGHRQNYGEPPIEEKIFKVDVSEYDHRPFGFVIDPDRHPEIDGAPRMKL